MSYPTREERTVCWSARDQYWACLDKSGIKGSESPKEAAKGPCTELRTFYEKSCSSQWVKHFDRKRAYLLYKDKIENEGYEPLDDRSNNK